MNAALEQIRRLVDEGRIDEARDLAPQFASRWPDSAPVQHWNRVLSPPRVIARGPEATLSRDQELRWITDHAHEHPGCWMAIDGDRLIAASPDRKSVIAAVRQQLGNRRAVLWFEPGKPG